MKNRFVKVFLLAGSILLLTQATACGTHKEKEVPAEEIASASEIAERKEAESEIPEEPEETDETEMIREISEVPEEIVPEVDKEALKSQLTILQDPRFYTYADMISDTELLNQIYPDLLQQDSIGTTADGRELYHYIVGNLDAEKQIFINAAIHAREYLTFHLVMKQMCVYLEHVEAGDIWGEISYRDMWDSVAIHVVPLINPDGVQISQFGLNGIQTESVLQNIYNIAANDGVAVSTSYLDHWKANAEGVDLNRNFDAYWEYYEGTGYPSADHYKGTNPGSAVEAEALIRLTEENDFLYTISYHTQGHVIYWCFENMDSFYDIAADWVSQLSAQTGYYLESNFSTVDPAGYSDWAIYRCQIPSVVIEVCLGESPYLADQFQQVWQENLNIWEITVREAMNR